MFKLMIMMKKKPGMSAEDFRAYYEGTHAPLGLSIMPLARHYRRHYLDSRGSKASPVVDDAFDVVTEVWFDSLADYERTKRKIAPEDKARLQADEFNLFDREATRYYGVAEESESAIPR